MDILDGKMICSRCTGDLDETDDIQNNMDETSWQNGASFHVKMFVKHEIRAGLMFPRASACNAKIFLDSQLLQKGIPKLVLWVLKLFYLFSVSSLNCVAQTQEFMEGCCHALRTKKYRILF